MRYLITRPEPDALKLKAALEAIEHEATVEPLLTTTFDDPEEIDLAEVQAIIATSRNGLRALKQQGAHRIASALPVFAVGKATANEARTLGFELIVTGAGTASDLVPQIVSACDPQAGFLLHLRGDEVAANLRAELEAHGFRLLEPIVYHMVPATEFTPDTFEQIASGEIDGVLLFSPRTARIYVDLIERHRLTAAARRLTHVCLSAAVAAPLKKLGPTRIEVADKPTLNAILELLV